MSTPSLTRSPSAPRTSTLRLAALGALALAAVALAIVLSTNGSSNSTTIGRATPSQVATPSRALSLQPGVVQNAAAPAARTANPGGDRLSLQPGVVQNAATPAARTASPGGDRARPFGVGRFSVPGHEH